MIEVATNRFQSWTKLELLGQSRYSLLGAQMIHNSKHPFEVHEENIAAEDISQSWSRSKEM